jgi:riboflavin-specific deaminase-like protein
MSEIDAAQAWELLREVPPGERSGRTVRRRDGSGEETTLVWNGDGSWHTQPDCTAEASELIDLFLPLRRARDPVIGQLGLSLDGRIATEEGHSHYINGPEDQVRLHRVRALVDAVIVGAGTAAADDPQLTVRRAPGENPVRVVLDPRGRVPEDRTLFHDQAAQTLWLQEGPPGAERSGPGPHVRILNLAAGPDGYFEPNAVLEVLRGRGLGPILVEGGGRTVSRFLEVGALDRLHLSVAPLLIGSGRPAITLPPIRRLDEALRPPVRHFRLGDDLLFDLSLERTPRGPSG